MLDYVSIVFGVVIALGGIIGYAKTGSSPSLSAGLLFGCLIGLGAYFTSRNPPSPYLLLAVSTILAIMMGFRWGKTGKFMPAGLVTISSVGLIIYACIAFWKNLPFAGEEEALALPSAPVPEP